MATSVPRKNETQSSRAGQQGALTQVRRIQVLLLLAARLERQGFLELQRDNHLSSLIPDVIGFAHIPTVLAVLGTRDLPCPM